MSEALPFVDYPEVKLMKDLPEPTDEKIPIFYREYKTVVKVCLKIHASSYPSRDKEWIFPSHIIYTYSKKKITAEMALSNCKLELTELWLKYRRVKSS